MLSDTILTEGVFVAVDIESTGSMPGRNDIIELGAARIEHGVVTATFGELVRPNEGIPYSVQALTGITDRMVADAPPIADVFERFREFAEGAVFIAHNYRFDLGFLDYLSEMTFGHPLARPVLDTLALAKKLHPDLGKYNLGLLSATYGVDTTPTHRADADALATAQVFLAMIPALQEQGLETVGEVARFCRMGGQQHLAHKLAMTTDLPDDPGIYLLRDTRGRVIYVGRAKNLRLRLRSYFYVNSDASGPRLGDETVSVQYIPLASTLDAVLLQSRLIDRYRPKHNITNQRGDVTSIVHVDTSSRFPSVKVTTTPRKRGVSVGPFVNRWAVEAVVEQIRQLYGLRRCSARITGHLPTTVCEHREADCPSPCIGGIEEQEYLERVRMALAELAESPAELRRRIADRHDAAARDGRHDEALRTRDALKALDRAMAGLLTVQTAAAEFGVVIVETEESALSLHLVRHGHLVRTLRLTKEQCAAGGCEDRIRRSIRRAYFEGPYESDPMRFSHQQLKDVFLIANHRQQVAPKEIAVTPDEDATVSAVLSALRRQMRVTRRRHVLSSTA